VWRIRKCEAVNDVGIGGVGGYEYSDGGDKPMFGGHVASWASLGTVKAHISRVARFSPSSYAGAELVEFDLVEAKTESLTAKMMEGAL
jgi:hypothetical protein